MESPYSNIGFNPVFRPPTGFNIPMLDSSDGEKNISDIQDEKKEEEIPVSEDGFDWKLVVECSPEEIAEKNDIDTLEAIVKSFTKSKFSRTDSKILPTPLSKKLFRILQIAINYLLDCQKQLTNEINDDETQIETLKFKTKKYKNLAKLLKEKQQKPDSEKCIVCGRKFKNISYLDSHMERRHNALLPAWKSLRCGEIHGLQDIISEIENLRGIIAQTRKETRYARKKRQEQPKPIPMTQEQLELINNLKNNQEVLIAQTKEKDTDQNQFQSDIRKQLDEAIAALRESHEKWITQIKNRETEYSNQILSPSTIFAQQQFLMQQQEILNKRMGLQESESEQEQQQPDPHAKIIQDLNLLVDTVQIPPKEEKKERKESDENANNITLQDMLERMGNNADLINTIEGEEVAKKPDEEEFKVMFHPGNRLIAKAKAFINREPDYDNRDEKDAFINKEEEKIKKEAEDLMQNLKKKRGAHVTLTSPYLKEQIGEDTPAYSALYDKLLFEVRRMSPISEVDTSHLFNERDVFFPRVPPLDEVKGLTPRIQLVRVGKDGKEIGPSAVPMTDEDKLKQQRENVEKGYSKVPYAHKVRSNRTERFPDDSDIETVSWHEYSSEHSIPFAEDPLLYVRRQKKAKQKFLSVIDKNESESSKKEEEEKIIPLTTDEVKELNIDVVDFATSSSESESDDKPKKEKVTKSPTPQDKDKEKDQLEIDSIFGESVSTISSSPSIDEV